MKIFKIPFLLSLIWTGFLKGNAVDSSLSEELQFLENQTDKVTLWNLPKEPRPKKKIKARQRKLGIEKEEPKAASKTKEGDEVSLKQSAIRKKGIKSVQKEILKLSQLMEEEGIEENPFLETPINDPREMYLNP